MLKREQREFWNFWNIPNSPMTADFHIYIPSFFLILLKTWKYFFPRIDEVQTQTGETHENGTEFQKSAVIKLIGMFQLIKSSLCLLSSKYGWWLLLFWFFFFEKKKKMKKNTHCKLSQKLRHEYKKVHEQNIYQIKLYVCSPNFSKISPQTKRSSFLLL